MKLKEANNPLELYLHIPFCVKKCDYCDFLSGPATREVQNAYVQALVREIQACRDSERPVSTVFIGGGTPSVLAPEQMEPLLAALNETFSFLPDAELSIEANPGTVDRDKLKLYRNWGINRISLGLQSADDRELRELGRIHTYRQFLESFDLAREAGFSNLNVDLMSAIPGQSYEQWITNLRTVAKLKPEHISAYSLIVEEGTPFGERELSLPDEDTEYRMYEDTAAVLSEYGYQQYEISNYARAGYACRHNEGYWKRRDYLGFGLGAASLMGKERFSNTRNMDNYLKNSAECGKVRENREVLSTEDEMAEFMFLGLRMTEGVSRREFQECFGVSMDEIYGTVLKKYKGMELLEEKNGRIFLSRRGIHVSNSVMSEFLL